MSKYLTPFSLVLSSSKAIALARLCRKSATAKACFSFFTSVTRHHFSTHSSKFHIFVSPSPKEGGFLNPEAMNELGLLPWKNRHTCLTMYVFSHSNSFLSAAFVIVWVPSNFKLPSSRHSSQTAQTISLLQLPSIPGRPSILTLTLRAYERRPYLLCEVRVKVCHNSVAKART